MLFQLVERERPVRFRVVACGAGLSQGLDLPPELLFFPVGSVFCLGSFQFSPIFGLVGFPFQIFHLEREGFHLGHQVLVGHCWFGEGWFSFGVVVATKV